MKTLLEKFLAKTRKTRGCWWWTGCLDGPEKRAYMRDGKRTRNAAQIAYELFQGPIVDGLHVLHTCDNPACVNPNHLYLGTHQQNMADRERRRRGFLQLGAAHPYSKLTTRQILEIRKRYRRGNGVQLANEYGITKGQVSLIVNHKRRTHS